MCAGRVQGDSADDRLRVVERVGSLMAVPDGVLTIAE